MSDCHAELAPSSCPCPASNCERDVACRPPAPTCPHPFYRRESAPVALLSGLPADAERVSDDLPRNAAVAEHLSLTPDGGLDPSRQDVQIGQGLGCDLSVVVTPGEVGYGGFSLAASVGGQGCERHASTVVDTNPNCQRGLTETAHIPHPEVAACPRPDCPGWVDREDEDVCSHEWLDRPESDTYECLICGVEGQGYPPALYDGRRAPVNAETDDYAYSTADVMHNRDAATRAVFEAGVRQAVMWLRADYEYGAGPDWRQHGCEWIAERLAEWRLSYPPAQPTQPRPTP